MLRLIFTPRSLKELRAISDYIAAHSPRAAAAVVSQIEDFARTLAEHPGLGRPLRQHAARIIPVPRLPYLIVFRERRGRLEILNVRHGKRRPLQ